MLTRFLSYHVLSVRSVVLICLVDVVVQFLFEDAEIFNLASSSPAGSALPAFLLLSIYRNQHQHQLCHNHDINSMLENDFASWSSLFLNIYLLLRKSGRYKWAFPVSTEYLLWHDNSKQQLKVDFA